MKVQITSNLRCDKCNELYSGKSGNVTINKEKYDYCKSCCEKITKRTECIRILEPHTFKPWFTNTS